MTTVKDCIQGTLSPYIPNASNPWNAQKVRHLYNRIAFGATIDEVEAGLTKSPGQLIDELFAAANAYPLPSKAEFEWADDSDGDDSNSVITGRSYNLIQTFMKGFLQEGMRHKLALFWSNHFVTESGVYGRVSTWMFQYYYILHLNALGDFKKFVMDIGLTPAMLRYLDGRLSRVGVPNENYARELLELFTMGEGNYTQLDIEEISRVLTGWVIQYTSNGNRNYQPDQYGEYLFNPARHDWGQKDFFGRTLIGDQVNDPDGQKEYAELHDTIFEEKASEIANFICTKLYKYYIYEEVNQDFVDEMAALFISTNFQIEPVLKAMFKSEHFFAQEAEGVRIKSVQEFFYFFIKKCGLVENEDYFFRDYETFNSPHANNPNKRYALYHILLKSRIAELGQQLFNPVDVAGWPEYHTWINEFTLITRWKEFRDLINIHLDYEITHERYRTLMKRLSNDSTDPRFVTQKIIEHFFSAPIPVEELDQAEIAFKEVVPSNYFIDDIWNLDYPEAPMQFICLMSYLVTLPEYQLA